MKDIRGNRENRIIKNSKGFTLLETLLVVAIIAVLLGISIMGVVAVQKELRQRELDSKAEVIYMAAQNRLMELKASGRAEFYSPDNLNDVHQLGLIPLDSEDENRTEESLFYVTSSMTGTGELSTASVVLPESRVEKEIRDNSWVIEYDLQVAVYMLSFTARILWNMLRKASTTCVSDRCAKKPEQRWDITEEIP